MAFLILAFLLTIGVVAGILYAKGGNDNLGTSVATIRINESPSEVFIWVSSPSYTTRWIKRLDRAHKISKGDIALGSVVRETMKVPRAKIEITGTVTKFEMGKLIETEYYISAETLKRGDLVPQKRGTTATRRFFSTFELKEVEENITELRYTVRAEYGRWYTRLLEPLVTEDAEKAMLENLEKLKTKVEKARKKRVKKALKRKEREAKKALKKKKAKEKKDLKQDLKKKLPLLKKEMLLKNDKLLPNFPFDLKNDSMPGLLPKSQLKPMLNYQPPKNK